VDRRSRDLEEEFLASETASTYAADTGLGVERPNGADGGRAVLEEERPARLAFGRRLERADVADAGRLER
jgi:hypothetical protein